MSEKGWPAIFEQISALPEQQQARLTWNGVVLQVERRGHVFVALREIPSMTGRSTVWPDHCASHEGGHNYQLLYIAEKHFLCSWRRQPTEWDWLRALAAVQL